MPPPSLVCPLFLWSISLSVLPDIPATTCSSPILPNHLLAMLVWHKRGGELNVWSVWVTLRGLGGCNVYNVLVSVEGVMHHGGIILPIHLFCVPFKLLIHGDWQVTSMLWAEWKMQDTTSAVKGYWVAKAEVLCAMGDLTVTAYDKPFLGVDGPDNANEE
ncbi:hypothetical protein B0H34DRAFT_673372 [Crassisporium funariophilum]|nr:hypothetical protein B0H34DRAFT_673372 [Crassisporium funariophilum]